MIVYLAGILRHKDATSCTIDCQGVGYGVELTAHAVAKLGPLNAPCEAHIYTHVAEDQLRLYGFVDQSEKQAFVALLAAQGVGPKLAMTILSTLSTAELYRAALGRVPGIGKKKAERLVLDLEGRLAERIGASLEGQSGAAAKAGTLAEATGGPLADARAALVQLGFNEAQVSEAVAGAATRLEARGLPASHAAMPELVRLALQTLTPR